MGIQDKERCLYEEKISGGNPGSYDSNNIRYRMRGNTDGDKRKCAESSADKNTEDISADSTGGAGIFAYSDGTVYAADTTIKTTQDTSGGIHAADGVFYTTNTESDIALKDVNITYNNDNEYFLRCSGNNNERGWGESGSNGADCDFTATSQDMEGDVIWDSIHTFK